METEVARNFRDSLSARSWTEGARGLTPVARDMERAENTPAQARPAPARWRAEWTKIALLSALRRLSVGGCGWLSKRTRAWQARRVPAILRCAGPQFWYTCLLGSLQQALSHTQPQGPNPLLFDDAVTALGSKGRQARAARHGQGHILCRLMASRIHGGRRSRTLGTA